MTVILAASLLGLSLAGLLLWALDRVAAHKWPDEWPEP